MTARLPQSKDSAGTPLRSTVIDRDGVAAFLVETRDEPSREHAHAEIELAGGRRIAVPRGLLEQQGDGTYLLPLSFKDLSGESRALPASEEEVLSIVEEQVTVGKRQTATGKVRVRKRVEESEEALDLPLLKERVEVRRVEIGAWIDAPVPVRQEGDTTVLPVMEEVLVVEKRLRLVEEIHLVKHRDTVQHRESVRLRRERAEVDREEIGGSRDPSE